MRIVVALGGNALARRGEPMTAQLLRENARSACRSLAAVAREHELVVTHGNGPQVGLIALQNLAYEDVPAYPLDILGAESQGMIGYVIQQELRTSLGGGRPVTAVLTTAEVASDDPAFDHPTKFVGPQYEPEEAAALASRHGWTFAQDGGRDRRVVPSPKPLRILQAEAISTLISAGQIVVCVGGGGVPVSIDRSHETGVQGVIDKDLASAALAEQIRADTLIILTDADYVVQDWGTPHARNILAASADSIAALPFADGSMGPKVEAAVQVARSGGRALIGPLDRLDDLLARTVGTEIRGDVDGNIIYTPDAS